jgi:hypothetical protein
MHDGVVRRIKICILIHLRFLFHNINIGVRFTPGGIRPGASGHLVTFIHPKGNDEFPIGGAGVLIELVQAPPNVIQALTPPTYQPT